jgi:hypothetical protein
MSSKRERFRIAVLDDYQRVSIGARLPKGMDRGI